LTSGAWLKPKSCLTGGPTATVVPKVVSRLASSDRRRHVATRQRDIVTGIRGSPVRGNLIGCIMKRKVAMGPTRDE